MGCCKSKKPQYKESDLLPAFHQELENYLEAWYELDPKMLGCGAYAKVYRATNIRSGSIVAVKRIDKDMSRREMLDAEIAIMRRFARHDNIVTFFTYFETDTEVQLVLEFMAGGELFDALVEKGPYGEADAVHYLSGVGSALEYLHQNNVAHRDLKPENLLLTEHSRSDKFLGKVKLSDFGLSTILEPNERMKSACGTWAYCAPEVLRVRQTLRGAYDVQCDMWSVGVILFVLLSGYHPFDRNGQNDEARMMELICSGAIDFEFQEWANASSAVKELLFALMEPDPVTRLSAKQLLQHPWMCGSIGYGHQYSNTHDELAIFKTRMRQKKLKAGLTAVRATCAFANIDQTMQCPPKLTLPVQTPAVGEKSRQDLVIRIFTMLDENGNGWLGERELLRFAKLMWHSGSDLEWKREFNALCAHCGWDTKAGVNLFTFKVLLETQESDFFCSDDTLRSLVPRLAQVKEATTRTNSADQFQAEEAITNARSGEQAEQKERKTKKKTHAEKRDRKPNKESTGGKKVDNEMDLRVAASTSTDRACRQDGDNQSTERHPPKASKKSKPKPTSRQDKHTESIVINQASVVSSGVPEGEVVSPAVDSPMKESVRLLTVPLPAQSFAVAPTRSLDSSDSSTDVRNFTTESFSLVQPREAKQSQSSQPKSPREASGRDTLKLPKGPRNTGPRPSSPREDSEKTRSRKPREKRDIRSRSQPPKDNPETLEGTPIRNKNTRNNATRSKSVNRDGDIRSHKDQRSRDDLGERPTQSPRSSPRGQSSRVGNDSERPVRSPPGPGPPKEKDSRKPEPADGTLVS